MLVVWKYPIKINDSISIEMPAGAQVLTVQMQGDQPHVWVLVDPDPNKPKETRRFRLAGTNHPIREDEIRRYVGTFQLMGGSLIYHLFER